MNQSQLNTGPTTIGTQSLDLGKSEKSSTKSELTVWADDAQRPDLVLYGIICGTRMTRYYWKSYKRTLAIWEALMFSSRRKHLSSMGKENTEENIFPSKRKWHMDDLHLLVAWWICIEEEILSPKLQKKVTMVRACGKNAGRKNCEERVYEYPRIKGATANTR
jgi:hypothetical protein